MQGWSGEQTRPNSGCLNRVYLPFSLRWRSGVRSEILSATVGSNKPKEAADRRVLSSNHTAFEVKTKKKGLMKPNIARQTSHGIKLTIILRGGWGIIKSYPNYSKKSLSFTHSLLPPPPSPSASLESTRQHHPPTTAVAEWMMSNRVGEWGHYRDAQLWIGTPEPSFVPHSQLPLTLKCAAHLTPGGETGVAAHFRYVFLKLKQAGLFWEGASTMLP